MSRKYVSHRDIMDNNDKLAKLRSMLIDIILHTKYGSERSESIYQLEKRIGKHIQIDQDLQNGLEKQLHPNGYPEVRNFYNRAFSAALFSSNTYRLSEDDEYDDI